MKKTTLITLVFFGFSFVSSAQEGNQNGKERITLYKVEQQESSNSRTQSDKKFSTPEEEIAYCNEMLNALDQKEAWIRNNPEELKIAQENGWFEKAEATRKELRERIQKLENK